MSEISRAALFRKLNPLTYKAIESATVFCKLRGNPYVELAHWLHQIMQLQDSDLHRLVQAFSLNIAHLSRDMTAALDRLPRGATSITDLSAHVEEAVERGWVYGTLMYGDSSVRSAYLLVGLLKTRELRNELYALSAEFQKIGIDKLTEELMQLISGSPEDGMAATDGSRLGDAQPGEASGAMAPAQMGKQEALKQFTVDLTEQARSSKLDPIVGRDREIRQMIDILMRRRQNNPILTGEAGVGKTAVVEGFAQRIVSGDVPPSLKDVSIRTLDLGLLQAGASMKGEFENRLKQIIEEVQSSAQPIILFIDEAHTLIGAGGAAGTGDAANLLKPALARGTLRTVAATTWAEYKKYFEKDPALTRRFQVIQVEEPSEEAAVLMLRSMASVMEQHHKVSLLDEALEEAVKLSHRYIPARQLPDKAVSVLDTASARVAVSQHATPPEVEDCQKRIQALQVELGIINREAAVGLDVAERKTSAETRLAEETTRLQTLEQRWQGERELVSKILELRQQLRDISGKVEDTGSKLEQAADAVMEQANTPQAPAAEAPDRETLLTELRGLQAQLGELQGEAPLILPVVDGQAVAAVIAGWTGIPVGRMVRNEIAAVLKLGDRLNERVVGQRHALDMIARRIQTTRARLDNPDKPIGVFMLCGPSGVGKTETGLALAEALYGGEENIITINMSEFQEAHTVSTLKGSPPGYVGYGEGGILTEAVRRRPYSVVLLDEIEKAHADVHEIFFQVFDKGWMEDAEGRYIDFRNTLILLTTNVGTELIMSMCADPELMPASEGLAKALREPLLKVFPPALLGRLVIIPYYPLGDEILHTIIRLKLDKIARRVKQNHGSKFVYGDDVVQLIAARCNDVDSGARVVDAILTNTVLPAISEEFLGRMLEGKRMGDVTVTVVEGNFNYAFVGE
ncbi:type VI secretion system ATPase TssH [Candidatus Thiothrix sp. Deng01]|uniref:Type VI secretion system ATPase TssH n=1 Tax=Candidatus Thiothrix phosphatis TaxID=3112415 RepID=A0ABU6CXH3_9GAMM|nr:type VI secretion system ATPase TssH [Candidatus Thiothrix sp. Deng01]MEB4591276.1 type VI secretion system ATPase TssH [Candidatus Thiothrix sp. Deng01]